MQRVILAIRPPENLISKIQDLQLDLNKKGLPVKWKEPSELFITLNYLGRIDPVLLHTLQFRTLPDIVGMFEPFNLNFSFLESMYKRHESSFIYLLPGGEVNILKDLQFEISQALNKADLPQDRKFQPMLSIGDLEKSDHETTKERLQQISDYDYQISESFLVDHLVMYEVKTSKSGATYKKIARFRLSTV